VNAVGTPYQRLKVLRHLFYKLDVADTFAWEKAVFSPFDGVVKTAHNDARDRTQLNLIRDLIQGLIIAPRSKSTDIGYFFGNHVVIESNDGIFALFAHLKQGSVAVKAGEPVTAGGLIGQVGNSGNSIQPHLHFQLTNEPDFSRAVPLPFVFESYQCQHKGEWLFKHCELPPDRKTFRV